MKNNMEDIDQLIKETLTQEEAKFYDGLEQQGLFGMIRNLFTGKNSWFIITMNIVNLIFLGLFIYSLIQFFKTEDTNTLIKWLASGFIWFMGMIMIKIYHWMQMDKKSLLREMKRLELQVSSLAGKLSK